MPNILFFESFDRRAGSTTNIFGQSIHIFLSNRKLVCFRMNNFINEMRSCHGENVINNQIHVNGRPTCCLLVYCTGFKRKKRSFERTKNNKKKTHIGSHNEIGFQYKQKLQHVYT